MKKTILYLLIAALLLTLTGCGLSKKQGFCELVILGDHITREDGNPLTKEATVTINGETKLLGQKFVLRTGTYKAKIKDENFEGTLTVKLDEVNKTVTIKPTLKLMEVLTNAWKFVFDPEKYSVEVENEVHLVGGFGEVSNDETWWKPHYMGYPLIKQLDGTWSAIFNLPEGTEFEPSLNSSMTVWNGMAMI